MQFTMLNILVPRLESKIEKFVKKYGDIVSYKKSKPYICQEGNKDKHKVVDIEIEGYYQINGYEFVASLEYVPEVGSNIIKKLGNSEIEILEMYYSRNCCDHCKTTRDRKYTVLLYNKENNEYIQVGRSCVRDFLGVSIVNYAEFVSFFDSMEEFSSCCDVSDFGLNENPVFDIKEVLEQTIEETKRNGYVSKSQIEKWWENHEYADSCPFETTAHRVYHIMNKSTTLEGKLIRPKYEVTEETKAEVEKVIDFVNNLEDNTEYNHSLKVLFELGYVENNNLGLVVSAVGYKIREEQKANKIATSKSDYVGNVGDRITVLLSSELVTSWETEYGITRLYKFTDENGNIYIWKTGSIISEDHVNLKGTIKGHNEFNGEKQTVLTRCKIM